MASVNFNIILNNLQYYRNIFNIKTPKNEQESDKDNRLFFEPSPSNALSPFELEHILDKEKELHISLIMKDIIKENTDTSYRYAVLAFVSNSFFDHFYEHYTENGFSINDQFQSPLMPDCIPIAKIKISNKENSFSNKDLNKLINDTASPYASILTLKGIEISSGYSFFYQNNVKNKTIFKPGQPIIPEIQYEPMFNSNIQSALNSFTNEPVSRFYEAYTAFQMFKEIPEYLSDEIEIQNEYYERIAKAVCCAAHHCASLSHVADYVLKEIYRQQRFDQFHIERSIKYSEIHSICNIERNNFYNSFLIDKNITISQPVSFNYKRHDINIVKKRSFILSCNFNKVFGIEMQKIIIKLYEISLQQTKECEKYNTLVLSEKTHTDFYAEFREKLKNDITISSSSYLYYQE